MTFAQWRAAETACGFSTDVDSDDAATYSFGGWDGKVRVTGRRTLPSGGGSELGFQLG